MARRQKPGGAVSGVDHCYFNFALCARDAIHIYDADERKKAFSKCVRTLAVCIQHERQHENSVLSSRLEALRGREGEGGGGGKGGRGAGRRGGAANRKRRSTRRRRSR
jgi:hypothetical protein